MSLNRSEQLIFDYWQESPDERRFWEDKVRSAAAESPNDYAAAQQLDRELWYYYEERAAVLPHFCELNSAVANKHATAAGTASAPAATRTSMRNLAELLLRLWAPPRPKPKRRAT